MFTFDSFTASQKGLYLIVLEDYPKDNRVASTEVSFFNVNINRQIEIWSSSDALSPSLSTVQYLESGDTVQVREKQNCGCFVYTSSGGAFKVYKLFSF